MLLQTVANDVQRSNTGVETSFGFNVGATAFRVLSDTLYQDKPSSIVRELSCNALDSHIQAGYPDRPFTIHLPNDLEPYLSIIDTGIGLDDNGVRNVFACYFNSTKSGSNATVGAFGLGGKVAFSYTNAFTVTAVFNGIRRSYSAFIGEAGVPAITLMGEEDTDAPNGVEVMVPVTETGDFTRFQKAVAEQLRFFKVKPNIINGSVIYDLINTVEVADGLSLYTDKNTRSYGNKTWIVQGGVGYPLNVNTVKSHLSKENQKFIDFLTTAGAVLEFPIGKIETTASREGVSYSKFTNGNIDALLTEARKVVAENMLKQVLAIETEWERALFINTHSAHSELLTSYDKNVFASMFTKMHPHYKYDASYSYGITFEKLATADTKAEYWKERRMRGGRYSVGISDSALTSITAKADMPTLIIRDTTDKPMIRIRHYVEQAKTAIVITTSDVTALCAELEEIGLEYVLLSNITAPPRQARVSSNSNYLNPTCYLFETSSNNSTTYVKDWLKVTSKIKELTDGGYYVVIPEGSRFHVAHMPANLQFIYNMMDAGELDKEVYAIRQREVKRVLDNPNWVPLQTVAEEFVKEHTNSMASIHAVAAYAINEDDDEDSKEHLIAQVVAYFTDNNLPLPSQVAKYLRALTIIKENAARMPSNKMIIRVVELNCEEKLRNATRRFSKMQNNALEAVSEKYPLLVTVKQDYNYVKGKTVGVIPPALLKHVADYVTMFDNVT